MSDMFIPPEGAMQFEVLRDRYGNDAPEPIVIWVIPFLGRFAGSALSGCTHHDRAFQIIMESLPHIMRSRSGMTRAGICECLGRIIE